MANSAAGISARHSSGGAMYKPVRAVPEIILRGGGPHFFFRHLHPQDRHGVRAPPPSGHVSALITPRPHYGSNTPWAPGQVTPPPHPSDMLSTKQPPPTGQKVPAAHPREDNFWNSPNAFPISQIFFPPATKISAVNAEAFDCAENGSLKKDIYTWINSFQL